MFHSPTLSSLWGDKKTKGGWSGRKDFSTWDKALETSLPLRIGLFMEEALVVFHSNCFSPLLVGAMRKKILALHHEHLVWFQELKPF